MAKKAKEIEVEVVKGPSTSDERKWRAEDALRTLKRAEEIKRDNGLMKEVERCRRDEMRALAEIKVETAPRTMKKVK